MGFHFVKVRVNQEVVDRCHIVLEDLRHEGNSCDGDVL